jgi:hypothetical protein
MKKTLFLAVVAAAATLLASCDKNGSNTPASEESKENPVSIISGTVASGLIDPSDAPHTVRGLMVDMYNTGTTGEYLWPDVFWFTDAQPVDENRHFSLTLPETPTHQQLFPVTELKRYDPTEESALTISNEEANIGIATAMLFDKNGGYNVLIPITAPDNISNLTNITSTFAVYSDADCAVSGTYDAIYLVWWIYPPLQGLFESAPATISVSAKKGWNAVELSLSFDATQGLIVNLRSVEKYAESSTDWGYIF